MLPLFYLAALVSVVATIMVITRAHAVHALLYLVVSLLAVALIFFLFGTPFAAALEVIIYAGAVMVLFVFVVMMLNPAPAALEQERRWLQEGWWLGPSVFALILAGEHIYLLLTATGTEAVAAQVLLNPKQVSIRLLGPYLIGVELASLLLLPGLIGAYHLGRRLSADGQR